MENGPPPPPGFYIFDQPYRLEVTVIILFLRFYLLSFEEMFGSLPSPTTSSFASST
jgi:hypothetical protein